MKPTQAQIERLSRHLKRLFGEEPTWQEVADYVLRRIAAAERRGERRSDARCETRINNMEQLRPRTPWDRLAENFRKVDPAGTKLAKLVRAQKGRRK
jgi:hypothetical protein